MAITLTDGRGELYQWDTGRTLTVDDATVTQVHFQNRAYGRTIDVDVKDGTAIIPDELLQKAGELRVFAFVTSDDGNYTKVERRFDVTRRNKPNDYMYTPTEQKSLEGLQNQIGNLSDLETNAKDNLVAAINEANKSEANVTTLDNPGAEDIVKAIVSSKSIVNSRFGTDNPDAPTLTILPYVFKYAGSGYRDYMGFAIGTYNFNTGETTETCVYRYRAETGMDGFKFLLLESPDTSLNITGATVGQIAKITAVDDSGKPTAWEAVDMPSGGEQWEKIAEIDFDVDAANDVFVWEYQNLPNYKELAYRKVSLTGSTENISGLSISINGSQSLPSGIGYSKNGGQSNGWGKILLLPFGWIHVNSGSANSPTNYAIGNLQTSYNAIPFNGDSITSVRLSSHPTYKIAGGKLSLYGRK